MANTNADVLRLCDTEANLETALREKMCGFSTDNKQLNFKAPGGTVYKYYNTADAISTANTISFTATGKGLSFTGEDTTSIIMSETAIDYTVDGVSVCSLASTGFNSLVVYNEAALDGSAPVSLRITDTLSGTGWTVGAKSAMIEFYSGDASSPGAGVAAQIATTAVTTAGGRKNLSFFVRDTGGTLQNVGKWGDDGFLYSTAGLFSKLYYNDGTVAAPLSGNYSAIYGSAATGRDWPFTENGHLVLEPRGSLDRSVVMLKTDGTFGFVFDYAGNAGFGIQAPDSRLHVWNGSAGSVTALAGTGVTVEDDNDCYVSVLAPTNKKTGLLFGDTDNDAAGLIYNHNGDSMVLRVATHDLTFGYDATLGTVGTTDIFSITRAGSENPASIYLRASSASLTDAELGSIRWYASYNGGSGSERNMVTIYGAQYDDTSVGGYGKTGLLSFRCCKDSTGSEETYMYMRSGAVFFSKALKTGGVAVYGNDFRVGSVGGPDWKIAPATNCLDMLYSADDSTFTSMGGMTEEGGQYITMIAGETLTRGQIVYQSQSGTGNRASIAPANSEMPIGVVYADTASGSAAKIVISGRAYVLGKSTHTLTQGYVVYVSDEAGRGLSVNAVPAAADHFKEVGHVLVSAAGNGLVGLCVVHFN